MPKIGDRRADGFYYGGRNGKYEHWSSPEAWEKRKITLKESGQRHRLKIANDPVRKAAANKKAAAYMKESRRSRPKVQMLARAKKRAQSKGLPFDLTGDDFDFPKICPVLRIPIRIGDGIMSDFSPELDRINNSKGYVPGNVLVISRRANRIKNDATLEELKAIVAFYDSPPPMRRRLTEK